MKKNFGLSVLLLSFLTIPPVAFGDDDGTKNVIKTPAPAPMISMAIGNQESKRPFSVSPEKYKETITPVYTKAICGGQVAEDAEVNLSRSLKVKPLGGHEYQIRARVDRVDAFQMEDESLTVPGTLILQMCQVYTPTIVTKRKTWTVESVNGVLNFKSTLNGESLMVKTL